MEQGEIINVDPFTIYSKAKQREYSGTAWLVWIDAGYLRPSGRPAGRIVEIKDFNREFDESFDDHIGRLVKVEQRGEYWNFVK